MRKPEQYKKSVQNFRTFTVKKVLNFKPFLIDKKAAKIVQALQNIQSRAFTICYFIDLINLVSKSLTENLLFSKEFRILEHLSFLQPHVPL